MFQIYALVIPFVIDAGFWVKNGYTHIYNLIQPKRKTISWKFVESFESSFLIEIIPQQCRFK